MKGFYLVPIETTIANQRGPKYFSWKYDPDPPALLAGSPWSMMDYGFVPYGLLVTDLDTTNSALLAGQTDVYKFPDDLDTPVTDPTIDTFFEGINVPTDWLTPSTSYRELLRQLAGMFHFSQRYSGIYGALDGQSHSLFDNADLSTRLRQMSAEEEEIFLQTVESYGYPRSIINTNNTLRQLIKSAGDFFAGREFHLGGITF